MQHQPPRRPDGGCLDVYTHAEIYMRTLAQSTININTIALSESSWLCHAIGSQLSRWEAAVKALTRCKSLTYLVCEERRRLTKDILINYDEVMTSSLATLLWFDRP